MAMPHSTPHMDYIPVEEDVGTWVVVRAPDSPESGTGPADALTGQLSNGNQALQREESVCSAVPDEEGWGEGEDEVDMGVRIGDKPLLLESRSSVIGRPGSRTSGSYAGSRDGSSRLSSKVSSVGDASDVPLLSEGNMSNPQRGDLNNSAVGKEPKLHALKEPTLNKIETAAAMGSNPPTHLGVEVLEPGHRESSSESGSSVPGSPADKPLHKNADLGPKFGEDYNDRGVGFGEPVVLDKKSKSQKSQVEKSKNSMKMSQSSNSLMRNRHSSGKSLTSEKSFRSDRGPHSSRGKSVKDRLREFCGRSSSNMNITDLERSLSAKMAKQLSKAGGGEGTEADPDLQGSQAAGDNGHIIVPVEAHSVSLRPRRGSDRDEEVESNVEPPDLALGTDDQKVEHWLEKNMYRLDGATLVFCVLSLGLYVADWATDLKLSVEYNQSGHPVFGLGTLGIFLATVFLNILVGLFFYYVEWQRAKLKARGYLSARTKSCATDTSGADVDNLQTLLDYFQDDHGEGDDEHKEGINPQGQGDDGEPKMLRMAISLQPVICKDQKSVPTEHKEDGEKSALVPKWLWGVRIAFTLVGLGPVWRIGETLWHGLCTRKAGQSLEETRYHYLCFRQDSVTLQLLQLLEGFLEAAPQLIWQLYIYLIQARRSKASAENILSNGTVIYNTSSNLGTAPVYDGRHEHDDDQEDFDDVGMWQAITLSLSAVSLAVAPSLYQRAMRKDSISEMSWCAVAVYFIWRVCEVVPRVLCLALFASVFHAHIFIVIFIHWFLMVLWLHWQRASIIGRQSSGGSSPVDTADGGHDVEAAANEMEESRPINNTGTNSHSTGKEQPADVNYEVKSQSQKNTKCVNVLNSIFLFLLAHMLLFCHLNAKDGRTRFRALLYYFIFYLENVIMGVLWYRMTPDLGTWYHVAGFTVVMAASLFHVFFQLVYYQCCHPARQDIPPCLERRECKRELRDVVYCK